MSKIEYIARPVVDTDWVNEMQELTASALGRKARRFFPVTKPVVDLITSNEAARYPKRSPVQANDIEEKLIKLRNSKLSESLTMRPSRILIRRPGILLLSLDKDPTFLDDRVIVLEMLRSVTGVDLTSEPKFINIQLGTMARGIGNVEHGNVIHTLTDEAMPRQISLGQIAIGLGFSSVDYKVEL